MIDHVHANGQKFGLYFIPGLSTQAYEDNLQIYGTSCRMQDIAEQPLRQADEGRLAQQTVFHQSGLDYGTHTIKAVKKSGIFMLLDQINVLMPNLISPAAIEYDRSDSAAGDVVLTAELQNQHPEQMVYGRRSLCQGRTTRWTAIALSCIVISCNRCRLA